MTELSHVGELEIDDDMRSTRRIWRMERIGWVSLALVLLLAALGVFGRAPLAHATIDAQGARLEYERILRHGAPSEIRLHVGAEVLRGDSLRVWASRDWVDAMEVKAVVPEPRRVATGGGRVLYVISVAGGDSATVTWRIDPDGEWDQRGELAIEGGPTIAFRQFILP